MAGLWKIKVKALGLAFVWLAVPAQAESRFETGDPAPLTPSAHLDFTIIIPDFIYLGFGSGSRANGNSISTRIISNNGTLALSLQSSGQSAIFGEIGAVTSGAITNSNARLTFTAALKNDADAATGVNSHNCPSSEHLAQLAA